MKYLSYVMETYPEEEFIKATYSSMVATILVQGQTQSLPVEESIRLSGADVLSMGLLHLNA